MQIDKISTDACYIVNYYFIFLLKTQGWIQIQLWSMNSSSSSSVHKIPEHKSSKAMSPKSKIFRLIKAPQVWKKNIPLSKISPAFSYTSNILVHM